MARSLSHNTWFPGSAIIMYKNAVAFFIDDKLAPKTSNMSKVCYAPIDICPRCWLSLCPSHRNTKNWDCSCFRLSWSSDEYWYWENFRNRSEERQETSSLQPQIVAAAGSPSKDVLQASHQNSNDGVQTAKSSVNGQTFGEVVPLDRGPISSARNCTIKSRPNPLDNQSSMQYCTALELSWSGEPWRKRWTKMLTTAFTKYEDRVDGNCWT